jgi:hypothetical protein
MSKSEVAETSRTTTVPCLHRIKKTKNMTFIVKIILNAMGTKKGHANWHARQTQAP